MGRVGLPLLLLFALWSCPLSAQEQPAAPGAGVTAPSARATGVVRTANGVPVPGANLRLVETASGRAWVSWTDENGRFDLPGLLAGHYRVDVSLLGFDNATQEFDLGNSPSAINVTLKVASLESIEAAAAAQNPGQTPAVAAANPPAKPASPDGGNNPQPPGQSSSDAGGRGEFRRRLPGNAPRGGTPSETGQNGGAAQGSAPARARGPAARRGGFQQVLLNNQAGEQGQEAEAGQQVEGGAPNDAGPLGQAGAAGAVLMNGTVGRGDQNAGFGGFPQGGIFLQGPGDAGQTGFGGASGGFRGGAPAAQPGGAGGPGLAAGPGGPGGFGGGPDGPGIAVQPPGRDPAGPGGRGAPPPGVTR